MDLSTIHQRLESGPSEIEKAAKDVAEKKNMLDIAKRNVERAKAAATLRNRDAKNTTILNALVIMDTEVDQAEAQAIKSHAEHLIAVSKWERQKDEFDAVRKQANLLETSIRSGIHG